MDMAVRAGSSFGTQRAATGSTDWQVQRQTYDSHGTLDWTKGKATLVRSEGQAPVADAAVNAAHDNAKTVFDFYKDVLGRDGIDGKGSPIVSIVHGVFPTKDQNGNDTTTGDNAAWVPQIKAMVYGDGDGQEFGPLTGGLDVVAHELTHGVTDSTAHLKYEGQSGALNESWSDVMGELVQQWSKDKAKFADPGYAKQGAWLIGEDVYTPGKSGDALRSMKSPGTANPEDNQPATMSNYMDLPNDEADDNGGVHINSGIPNKAAYEAATKIGDEKLAKIWYKALTDYLKPNSSFSDGARSTIQAAKDLYANDASVSQAVQDAWAAVGVDPAKPSHLAPVNPSVGRHETSNIGVVPQSYTRPAAG